MDNTIHPSYRVRKMLEKWHDTGILPNAPDKIIAARNAYQAMLDASFMIPGCDIIRTDLVMELEKLNRIIKSRGYE